MSAEAALAAANMINQNRQQNTNTALTLGGMIFNAASQYQQNVWNERLMEKQNQWNIDQWNRENAYNTPLAQMQRLAAAGINPSLAFSNGQLMNEAAASPQMQASQGRAMSVDPLALAQARLMTAQADQAESVARKTDEETQYQRYLNQVEEALQNIPIGQVVTYSEDGVPQVQVNYGNYHVKIAERTLKELGLNVQGLELELADLYYNYAVMVGSDIVISVPTASDGVNPSDMPNYDLESNALRGDMIVRQIAGELAKIEKAAADAEKAGREAYSKWLDENKDNKFVQFFLAVQGFFQTFGISIPHFGFSKSSGSSDGSGNRAGWRNSSVRKSRSFTVN